jgi:hypothetical protein
MMVGKNQLKHLSTLGYSRVLAKSTNMITVNCTIAIIEPLSAVYDTVLGIVTALLRMQNRKKRLKLFIDGLNCCH